MDHTYCLKVESGPPANSISENVSSVPKARKNNSTVSNGGKMLRTYSKKDINLFRPQSWRSSTEANPVTVERPQSRRSSTEANLVNRNPVSPGESSSGAADVECTILHVPQMIRVKIEPVETGARDEVTQTEISSISRNPLKSFSIMTDQQIENHTGFHPNTVRMIWSLLADHHPKAFVLESALTTEDQLLLVLYKYRHNPETSILADEFAIGEVAVSLLIRTITSQLYELFKSIDFWKFSRAFSVVTGACKAIVDVTQISVSSEAEQSRRIMKALLSATECGCFNFCSDLYHSEITDEQLVAECRFADHLKSGDRVLTGKSINISSFGKKILLNVVPTSSDWEIGRKRTIIERLLAMVKTNRILTDCVDSQLANQVLYNCVMLCNFKPNSSTTSSVAQEDQL